MNLRTEEFRQRLVDAKAQWFEREGAEVVAHYGSPDTEYWAVRDGGLGLVDRSERETVVLSGPDTILWLQGLVTNDLLELEREGSGQRSAAVNHIGRTIADLRILHAPDMLVIDLEPGTIAEGFVGHLEHHVIMEDVTIADRTAQTGRLGLFGERAPALLGELFDGAHRVSALTEDYQGSWGELAGCDVLIQRVPLVGAPGFDIFCDRDEIHLVWDALLAASPQVRLVGDQALETLRLEAGHVRYGAEYDEKVIPIEADLNPIISYDKGCYLGQEIIHRLDTRGRPARFLRVLVPEDANAALAEGDVIRSEEGKKVGALRVAFSSPMLDDHPFALAYVKRGAYDVGTRVTITHGEDAVTARVAALGEPLRMMS